ncbi:MULTISPECIES: hypothetical protein [unclassified Paenibacillus]|uniref:hypothetical protein n=1 Tax=unclassified Paenibacillus TaxID=185978 RepID=UPI0004669745|nr:MULTISPECIES: hypothetical protein [unclassified Paenibacillus]KGP83471.1 hypothetical protein P364_0107870 [Paenibacillus sp. MAEPY2]KGP86232.1 hypothetical protein P363_0118255 [Paenibacillus sp. MAEPY1]
MTQLRVVCWLFVITLTVGLYGCSAPFSEDDELDVLSQDRLQELREEYPLSPQSLVTPWMKKVTFKEIMDFADAVVVAEVVSVLPNFSMVLPTEPDTPERKMTEKQESTGMTPYEAEFISYEVKVKEVITGGTVAKETFLFYNAAFAGIEPTLKPGQRIVTAIKKGVEAEQRGGYSFSRYGTYYIVEGDYVLSAYEGFSNKALEFTKQTNGIRLEKFVKRVRSLAQE